ATCAAANSAEQFLSIQYESLPPKFVEVAGIVAEHYARGGAGDRFADMIEILSVGDSKFANAVVRGLAKGWPKGTRATVDENLEANLEKLIEKLEPARRGELVKLVASWGSHRFDSILAAAARAMLETVRDPQRVASERLAAARELIAQRPADAEA